MGGTLSCRPLVWCEDGVEEPGTAANAAAFFKQNCQRGL
jgi:hypothetical protein